MARERKIGRKREKARGGCPLSQSSLAKRAAFRYSSQSKRLEHRLHGGKMIVETSSLNKEACLHGGRMIVETRSLNTGACLHGGRMIRNKFLGLSVECDMFSVFSLHHRQTKLTRAVNICHIFIQILIFCR